MAICARAIQQPDGSYLLGLDPSVTNPSTCPYVVETGTESALGSLAALTPEDAVVISWSVGALWVVAWGIKQAARIFMENQNVQDQP